MYRRWIVTSHTQTDRQTHARTRESNERKEKKTNESKYYIINLYIKSDDEKTTKRIVISVCVRVCVNDAAS